MKWVKRIALPLSMLFVIGVVGIVILLKARQARREANSPSVKHSLVTKGTKRTYRLYTPKNLPNVPVPLVIALHGGYGDALNAESMMKFHLIAEREKFVVAYPNGSYRHWNDGFQKKNPIIKPEDKDDVHFIDDLINEVSKNHKIDPSRIFATGMSNGAGMSHMLAVKRPGRFAAIAPVVGGLTEPLVKELSIARGKQSMIIIQGTADPLVPYVKNPASKKQVRFVDTPNTLALWKNFNEIAAYSPAEKTPLPNTVPEDSTTAYTQEWAAPNGAVIKLITVEGGGHTWPRGHSFLPGMGKNCQDFDASEVIWNFFKKSVEHPLKDP